jgi:YidC/Oxa1 family membrane protein insertase
MDRKSWIQMIFTIAIVVVLFFALQAWVLPKREPSQNAPNTPAANTAETPKVTDTTPSSQRTTEPTAADKEHGFDPITRKDANKLKLANEKLTAVLSERGGTIESLSFVNEKGENVFLHTPDDPTVKPDKPLQLINPSDNLAGIAPLALKLDKNDQMRNTSRWEAGTISTNDRGDKAITFRFPPAPKLESDGSVIFKTLTLRKDTFRIDVSLRIENHGSKSIEKVAGIWGAAGLTNDSIRGASDYARVALYGSTLNPRYNTDKGGDTVTAFEKKLLKYNEHLKEENEGAAAAETIDTIWLDDKTGEGYYLMAHGLRTRYFLAFLAADIDAPSTQYSGRIKPLATATEHTIACALVTPKLEIAADKDASTHLVFYVGPRDKKSLDAAWEAVPPKEEGVPNHWIELAPTGWPFIVTAPFAWVLRFLSGFLGTGLAIIGLTLFVRLLLSPLSFKGQKSMAIYTKKMKVVKPKLDAIKEKYADRKDRDAQLAMLQETREAMRAENVGFFPFGGCLPMLMQMPIFIGLYQTFANAFFLRHQSFLWIHDLSLPDASLPFSMEVHWLPGFVGGFLAHNGIFTINVLPLAWIALSLVQMRMQPKPDDPQQAAMQKQMGCIFPIMGLMLYSYASGFALYFMVSSIYSLIETKLIKRHLIAAGITDPPKAKVDPDAKPEYRGAK